jgi:hypothetical protein
MSIDKKRAPRFRVGDPISFLYGTKKVAGEIVEDRGTLGDHGRHLYRVRINAGQEDESSFELPEEVIESRDQDASSVRALGLRQEFNITYIRKQKTNKWTATTKRGLLLYPGVKAKGAVGYRTVRWEGEREGDENHAIVTVFVECDQTMCDSDSRVRPTAWPVMTATARELADRMFRTRHQDAQIEHEGIES